MFEVGFSSNLLEELALKWKFEGGLFDVMKIVVLELFEKLMPNSVSIV